MSQTEIKPEHKKVLDAALICNIVKQAHGWVDGTQSEEVVPENLIIEMLRKGLLEEVETDQTGDPVEVAITDSGREAAHQVYGGQKTIDAEDLDGKQTETKEAPKEQGTKEKLDQMVEQKSSGIPGVNEWLSEEDIKIIKQTVGADLERAELNLFLKTCASMGLNPFTGEIWVWKDKDGKMIICAGRDGFVKAAQRHDDFGGIQSGVVYENDDITIDQGNATVHHTFDPTQDRGNIVGAWAKLNRKDGSDNVEFAAWKDYNRNNHAWKKNGPAMIRKVPEKLVCKKGYGMPMQIQEDWKVDDQGRAEVVDKSNGKKKDQPKERALLYIEDNKEVMDPPDIQARFSEEFLNQYPEVREKIEELNS